MVPPFTLLRVIVACSIMEFLSCGGRATPQLRFLRDNGSNFKFENVPADGNCLFHALTLPQSFPLVDNCGVQLRARIGNSLQRGSYWHQRLRPLFIAHNNMLDDPAGCADKDMEESYNRLRTPASGRSSWGNDMDMLIYSCITNVRVVVLQTLSALRPPERNYSEGGFRRTDTLEMFEEYRRRAQAMGFALADLHVPTQPVQYLYLHNAMYPTIPMETGVRACFSPNHFGALFQQLVLKFKVSRCTLGAASRQPAANFHFKTKLQINRHKL